MSHWCLVDLKLLILLPQSPKYLRLQACTTTPGLGFLLKSTAFPQEIVGA
jgi:hypothetical protein